MRSKTHTEESARGLTHRWHRYLAAALIAVLTVVGCQDSSRAASSAEAADAEWIPTFAGNSASWTGVELFPGGAAYAFTGGNVLYRSSDGGRTWKPLAGPEGAAEITRMSFSSPEVGFVAAVDSSDRNEIFRTVDGGDTWNRLPELPLSSMGITPRVDGLEAIPGTRSVVVTGWNFVKSGCDEQLVRDDHKIFRLRRGAWNQEGLPYAAVVTEVEFLDSKNALVLAHRFQDVPKEAGCGAYMIRTFKSFVLLTRDGGRTFKKIHVAYFEDESPVNAVAIPSPERIILGRKDGSILMSRNGGRRFFYPKGLQAAGGVLDALTFSTDKIGYAGTNGTGIWRTSDGGWSWELETSPFDSTFVNDEFYRGSIAAVGRKAAVASGPGALARRMP